MGDEPADIRWHIISSFFLKIIIIGKDIISHSYQSALCPSD